MDRQHNPTVQDLDGTINSMMALERQFSNQLETMRQDVLSLRKDVEYLKLRVRKPQRFAQTLQ